MRDAFLTTHWTLIGDIQAGEGKDQVMMGHLLERYWRPVYCYLRQKGYDNERSKDLTQGFFCDVVLDRNLSQRADQTRGRFRSFLLHALNHYLADQHRMTSSKKRAPESPLLSLEMLESSDIPSTLATANPESAFDYAWKTTLLDRVLSQTQVECEENGLTVHWRLFLERVVRPILDDTDAPPLKELCQRHGVPNEAKASNMMVTAKRRFQAGLRAQVRNTVMSDDDVDGELSDILKLFPKDAQDSK